MLFAADAFEKRSRSWYFLSSLMHEITFYDSIAVRWRARRVEVKLLIMQFIIIHWFTFSHWAYSHAGRSHTLTHASYLFLSMDDHSNINIWPLVALAWLCMRLFISFHTHCHLQRSASWLCRSQMIDLNAPWSFWVSLASLYFILIDFVCRIDFEFSSALIIIIFTTRLDGGVFLGEWFTVSFHRHFHFFPPDFLCLSTLLFSHYQIFLY